MKIITKTVEYHGAAALPENALFFDIETTGLSPLHAQIYLIGSMRAEGRMLCLTQWLDETGTEEQEILRAFAASLTGCEMLVHFNGAQFDLPFAAKRLALYGITDPLPALRSLDLYQCVYPFKNILGLPNYRQQTLEALFDSGRAEHMSGGDLIPVYREYVRTGRDDLRDRVLSHNEADLQGLLALLPLRAFGALRDAKLCIDKAYLRDYPDVKGNVRQELIMVFQLSSPALPQPVAASYDGCYLRIRERNGILKVPVFSGELKLYYEDYRNYYYVPEMDEAVHKSVSSFLDFARREKATAATAYTRRQGMFLPQYSFRATKKRPALLPVSEVSFVRSYGDDSQFLELTPQRKSDKVFFERYAAHILHAVLWH